MSLSDLLSKSRIVPVLTISRLDDAVPLARALAAGGLTVIEVALRTEAALQAINAIASAVPDAVVGAGTVTRPKEFAASVDAGARFAVSPGFSVDLSEAAAAHPSVPFLPGVATASEAMAAASRGYDCLKFFPAEPSGGIGALKAMSGPFPSLKFCPTGGINAGNANDYLALANVVAVGGSWVAPEAAIRDQDWDHITALAKSAVSL